jgi:hypothetical protein
VNATKTAQSMTERAPTLFPKAAKRYMVSNAATSPRPPPSPAGVRIPASSFDPVAPLKSLGNVIFLGKISQTKCTGNEFSADNPFGCEFLKKAASVARADGRVQAKDVAKAVSLVDVNMRRSVPRISGTQAFYDCPVRVVKRGETVRLKGVAAFQYVGDSFLWGVVDAPAIDKCSRS